MSDKEIENYIQARRLTNGLFTKDPYGDRVILKNMSPNEINIIAATLGATQKADYFANKEDASPYSVHYFNDEKKEILYVIPNMQNVDSVSSNIFTPPRVWSETLLDGLTNWEDISGDIKVKVYDEETLGAIEESLGKEIIKHFNIKYNKKDDRYETSFGQKTIKGIGAMAVNLLREQDLLNFPLKNIDTENMPQEQAKRLGNIFIDRFNLTLKNNSNWDTKRVETSFGTKQSEGVGKMVLNLYCEQISSKMIDIAPPSQDNLPPARPIEECVADIEEMDKKARASVGTGLKV